MRTVYDDNRIRKDVLRKKISGVCAGLARHWDTQPWLVRLVALLCFFSFPMVTVVAYAVMALVLPNR
ncbi:PspC domain-containing protein [Aliiglaciecola sp. CAU 1673]|uniref:PspC domain-containing protein n=1 Tax=Aliiglaciecola sp. CAU 1673 TaxID=3032595 RepID=UPI0023D9F872|nr:PspC domain-containing protein [Aliiglaciecola sp. CAU 1673]MDF2180323.1 PspC domain-containing protein [Aliiglaciecola sp. CAU 1673]